jgi:hypothetical protein
MYLGEWAVGSKGIFFSENVFGAAYNNWPAKCKGKIYIGKWKNGMCHGWGKSLWLESFPAWKKNKLPASEIKQKEGKTNASRPYLYIGDCANNLETMQTQRSP